MKRTTLVIMLLAILMLVFVLCFSLVACGEKLAEDKSDETTSTKPISLEQIVIEYNYEIGNSVPQIAFTNNTQYTISKILFKRKYHPDLIKRSYRTDQFQDEYIILEADVQNLYPSQKSAYYYASTRCSGMRDEVYVDGAYEYTDWYYVVPSEKYSKIPNRQHFNDSEDYSLQIWYFDNEGNEQEITLYY